MAWSGWWHNQIGLLTEVASARIAAPVEQLRAPGGVGYSGGTAPRDSRRPAGDATPLMPPTDTTARTEYPRPWLGGRWTLRDVVDYEMITTMALLETAADRRETLLRQMFEVNRQTSEKGLPGVSAIVIPIDGQQDPREAGHLVERLRLAGVEVHRSDAAFDADGHAYGAGTYIVPMTQVFARYAKDLLERQTYPEVRRTPEAPAEPPYDVTAWSLGMLLGVKVEFLSNPLPPRLAMSRVTHTPRRNGQLTGTGARFSFDYTGPDTAIGINRLLKAGATVAFDRPSHVLTGNIGRDQMETIAKELGLNVTAGDATAPRRADGSGGADGTIRAPRVGLYAPWTSGNIDEGWTRWVLEQYEFAPVTLHNADIRAGNLRQRFDAIIVPEQSPREILEGFGAATVRPEYRGGLGDIGLEQLKRFMSDGGTVVMFGSAADLALDRWALPVRNIKRNVRRDQHSAPGTILNLDVDVDHPLGYGMAADSFGFYTNGPFFSADRFSSKDTTVIARYPASGIVASGWLKGEELMAGRAAVVAVEMAPGRLVLFGLRPQHRGQTHATFPLLFNALYQSTVEHPAASN